MVNTSATFKEKIKDGVTPQDLHIQVGDAYHFFARYGDIDSSGVEVTEYANPSTDIKFGEAPSSSFKATIVNRKELPCTFFNEKPLIKVAIGVEVSSASYEVPSNANAYITFEGSTYTATETGLLWNGVAISGINDTIYSVRCAYSNGIFSTKAFGEDNVYNVENGTLQTTGAYDSEFEYEYYKECKAFCVYGIGGFPKVAFYEDGTRSDYEYCNVGFFIAEKPTKVSTRTIQLAGYDSMQKLDIDASGFLANVSYPITIGTLVGSLCAYCDISTNIGTFLHSTDVISSCAIFPSGTYTCRQLLSWIAEWAKCFATFTRTANLSFKSISSTPVDIIGANRIDGSGLDIAEYNTAPVDKLVVTNLAGLSYVDGTGDNIYSVLGNPFWQDTTSQGLSSLSIPTYVPVNCTILEADPSVESGDSVTLEVVTNSNALISLGSSVLATDNSVYTVTIGTPIMAQTIKWNGTTRAEISATGGEFRETTSSIDNLNYNINCANNSAGLVSKIMASDLFAQHIEADDFVIKGGSININTNVNDDNLIQMNYVDPLLYNRTQTTAMKPNYFEVTDNDLDNTPYSTHLTSNGVQCYSDTPSTLDASYTQTGAYIGSQAENVLIYKDKVSYNNSGVNTQKTWEQLLFSQSKEEATATTVTLAANNTYYDGGTIDLVANGRYILTATAKLDSNVSLCRFGVAIRRGSTTIENVCLGGTSSNIQSTVIASNSTKIQVTTNVKFTTAMTVKPSVIAKVINGGTISGSVELKMSALRIE